MSHDPLAGLLRSFHLPTMASIYAGTLQQAEQHHWGYRVRHQLLDAIMMR